MFEGKAPRVFTIASAEPFVDSLAKKLLENAGGEPLKLAEMRVLLPTRRACRALQEAFLRQGNGKLQLLPRMTPLGDIDEEELSIADAGLGVAGAASLPPAIPSLERQMMLARAVMALPGDGLRPEQATVLALELAKLIDRLATEQVDPKELRNLVGDSFAEHWQKVLRFLEILIGTWPEILSEAGALDPAARRNALLGAQARLWQEHPPETPVIAAGSTGSIPATAGLLATVAGLPQGAVVLPGLDRHLADKAWEKLPLTHPQFGLKQLLSRLDIGRSDVRDWDDGSTHPRGAVLSDALVPADAPAPAIPTAEDITAALSDVTRLDCPGPSEEALAVALIMRETLETPGRTAALVTPDRDLARRVAAALRRWDIEIDDSAGIPLGETPPGTFLRLLADAARTRLAPVPLLAILKHPLAAGGMNKADFRELARLLETEALRGPRPGPGLDGLARAITGSKYEKRLKGFLNRLNDLLAPILDATGRDGLDYVEILKVHVTCAEALAATDTTSGAAVLWAEDAGEAVANFVGELATSLGHLGQVPAARYPAVFETLMDGRVVRPRFGRHPRLFVWGLLEARLQHADVVILGGLNEGVWPPQPETNPWMSRPMMADIGLEAPERRIGLTAHDFQQAFMASRVYLTRADRVGGTPTVPSRWLLRLDNLLARAGAKDALQPNETEAWLTWGRMLDAAAHEKPEPPRPCPPVEARPTELSATQIETLIRDPYAIYARKILGLQLLNPIDADPGAADRGIFIHDALEAFVRTYPDTVPDDAVRRLMEIGQSALAPHFDRPGVRTFWWPRFERIAHWFVDWHSSRLAEGWEPVLVEKFGGTEVGSTKTPFKVFAKPDRIDHRADIGLSIIDYKTGQPPSAKQVEAGLTPQLPLEAIIALAGQFKGVPEAPVSELVYVHLSGGREPAKVNNLKKLDVAKVIEDTRAGVAKLVTKFADAQTPYLSRPRPQFESRFGDFDHLARVGEWGGAAEDAE